jgi:hypothetical protein
MDLPSTSTGLFLCVAAPGSTSFTVPPEILANMPATRSNLILSKGVIYVGTMPTQNPATFQASGLDLGLLVTAAFSGKTVIFQ